jgi:hypothetical protein
MDLRAEGRPGERYEYREIILRKYQKFLMRKYPPKYQNIDELKLFMRKPLAIFPHTFTFCIF